MRALPRLEREARMVAADDAAGRVDHHRLAHVLRLGKAQPQAAGFVQAGDARARPVGCEGGADDSGGARRRGHALSRGTGDGGPREARVG